MFYIGLIFAGLLGSATLFNFIAEVALLHAKATRGDSYWVSTFLYAFLFTFAFTVGLISVGVFK